jgi:hypothetical protein
MFVTVHGPRGIQLHLSVIVYTPRGIQLHLSVIFHTPRGIQLHLSVIVYTPREYSFICLLFSIQAVFPGVYRQQQTNEAVLHWVY